MTRQISVICTGGTIACTTNESGALVPTVSGQQLVDAAQQQLRQQPTGHNRLVDELTFCVHDALQLDSSSIGLPELDTLLAAITEQATDPAVDAVVVTHGTDSMEESAFATALLVHGAPVVFTGHNAPSIIQRPTGRATWRAQSDVLWNCSQPTQWKYTSAGRICLLPRYTNATLQSSQLSSHTVVRQR